MKCFIVIGHAAAKDASQLIRTLNVDYDSVPMWAPNWTILVGSSMVSQRLRASKGRILASLMSLISCARMDACHIRRSYLSPHVLFMREGSRSSVSQCNLQNPGFTYLCACHTTAGDKENQDEVIHLAAAMQLAGFVAVDAGSVVVVSAHACGQPRSGIPTPTILHIHVTP